MCEFNVFVLFEGFLSRILSLELVWSVWSTDVIDLF